MADSACVHCAGLGEYLEHDANATRHVCHCDGACDACNGTGITYADDDFDGEQPVECIACLGSCRDPRHPTQHCTCGACKERAERAAQPRPSEETE